MTSATLAGSVDAVISGDVSGQVAVGNNIVQYNVAHGGVVQVAAPEELPDPQPRPLPLPANLRGRKPRKLVGRDRELAAAGSALEEGIPVQFYGPPGIGKTSLLKALAHLPGDEAPDGVLYHLAHGEDVDDTLQFLYETFYVSKVPFVATEAQLRLGLGGIQARIVLDDLGASRDELESLLDVLPAASFVIASPRRTLWGDGKAVALRGLGADAALELLERELGRSLEGEERAAGTAIVTALEGEALRILEVAAHVTERNEDLRALAEELSAARTDELHRKLVDSLTPDERAILEVMTALGGATLPAAELAEITGVADAGALVESLIRKGLLQAHSPRYSVTNGPAVAPLLDTDSWDRPLLDYFSGWAERNRRTPEKVLENAPAVLAVLSAAARNQASADLLRLSRAVEEPFVLAGRWGAWRQVLGHELTAARGIRDRAGEGWALHQLGTRALCQGDPGAARNHLTQALRIRESLGDVDGAAATRHNLRFLLGGGTPAKPAAYVAAAAPVEPPIHHHRPAAVLPAAGLGIPLLAIVGLVVTAALVLGGLAMVNLGTSSSDGNGGAGGGSDLSALRMTPASLDFGERAPGDPSPPRTVTVTNGGDEAIEVERVALTGAADAYRIEQDTCRGVTLERGDACTMALLFNPPQAGRFDGRLVVRSGGREGPSAALSGTGSGVVPPPPRGTGLVTFDPGAVDFGSRAVGDPPVVRDLTVVNGGTGDIQLQSVSVSGSPDFTISRNACPSGTLASNARCTVQLAFRPTAEGVRQAELAVATSDPAGSSVAILSGTGAPANGSCRPELPGPQTVPYGGALRLTARAAGSPTPAFTAQGLPSALGLVDNRNGTATISGTVQAIPGSYSPTVSVTSGGRACGSGGVPLTVTKAPVKVAWLQPLIDITPGSPAMAQAQVTQTAGTRGDLTKASVIFDLTNTVTREVLNLGSSPVDPAGRATLKIKPGEVPLGAYTARARIDPANQFFSMASAVPIAAVVNTDVLGASVYALSDMLNTLVPTL